jgi:hypothetical protein
MTDSPTNTGSSSPAAEATTRLDRWRSGDGRNRGGSAGRRIGLGAMLAMAALLAAAFAVMLVLAPLFSWQTGCAALVIDDYPLGSLEAVPFAESDTTALAAALSGRLAPKLGREVLQLPDFTTAESMRDRLRMRVVEMPLRRRDVLLAYVRGQCMVAPPLLDADGNERPDPLSGKACLIARDVAVRGERLRELVSCRDVLEAMGSAPNHTTVTALDMGDLRWDPRLGVLCNTVPRQLDRDLSPPLRKANGENWVIGSHDVLEYSGATVAAQRTFFSTAFEQGLAGAADAAPYGDGDKVVELHELATFVTIWTAEWARRSSGGRSVQRPVVWKLGTGRVRLEDLPRNMPLLRVSSGAPAKAMETVRKAVSQATGTALVDQPAPEAVSAPAAPASVASMPRATADAKLGVASATTQAPAESAAAQVSPPKPAETAGQPPSAAAEMATQPAPVTAAPSPAMPERSRDPWEQVTALSLRVGPPPQSVPRASPLDYAPHLWRHAVSFLAAASTDTILDGTTKARGQTAVDRFSRAIVRLGDPSPAAVGVIDDSPPVGNLRVAERAAIEAGIPQAWEAAPAAFRSAVAVRNDAVEIGLSMLDVIGKISGGAGGVVVQPTFINDYFGQIGRLSAAIAGIPSIPLVDFDDSRFDPLETAIQNTASQSMIFRSMAEKMISGLAGAAEASHGQPAGRNWMILLRSRLPEPRQRERIVRLLQTEKQAAMLVAEGRPPTPSSTTRRIDATAWKNVAALSDMLLTLIDAAGIRSTEATERMPPVLLPTVEEIAECRRAVVALANAAGDEHAASEIALRLAARISRLYSVAVAAANVLTDDRDGIGKSIDSDRVAGLLRIIDPRDAVAVGDSMIAGLARWNSAATLGMKLTVGDGEPKVGAPQAARLSVLDSDALTASAKLRFRYDPAEVALRFPDGNAILPGSAVSVRELPWRSNQIDLQITPLRLAGAVSHDAGAAVEAVIEMEEHAEKVVLVAPLPSGRNLILLVRGAPGTVAGVAGKDGWVRSERGSSQSGAPTESASASIVLEPWPSGICAWEFGLENVGAGVRKVVVDIHSVDTAADAVGRERGWANAEAAILAGTFRSKPLATSGAVSLPASGGVVPISLKPEGTKPPAENLPPPGTPGASPPSGNSEELSLPAGNASGPDAGAKPIAPDLAVVVHEQAADGSARVSVTRVVLSVQHPRDILSALARYDGRQRTITIAIEPIGGDPKLIPTGGLQASLQPLPTASVASVPPVVARKGTAVLTLNAPKDELVASWNGTEQGLAWLCLDVNGYPRAFTFAVDCSAAADGRPQRPQHDWRNVRILEPREPRTLIKAPAKGVPMRVAFDAPADTFRIVGIGSETDQPSGVAVVFRQIGASLSERSVERVVWQAAEERQVSFAFVPAPAPAALAVTTTVDDWTISASGEGFVNVDVSAEARLTIPGARQPIMDSREYVFDGTAPVLDVPPSVQAAVGRALVVPIRAADDSTEGYLIDPQRRRSGVSGLGKVEWAIDFEGTGTPKEWQPAAWLGGVNYELRVPTEKLPAGTRLPLLLRATDRVGLSDPPARIWLEVAAEPASKRNTIVGKLLLSGRGEPDLTVTLTGPGGPFTARSGANGGFRFDNLEPGEYKASCQGPIRNRIYRAEPVTVTVAPAPAPPASVTLELK